MQFVYYRFMPRPAQPSRLAPIIGIMVEHDTFIMRIAGLEAGGWIRHDNARMNLEAVSSSGTATQLRHEPTVLQLRHNGRFDVANHH